MGSSYCALAEVSAQRLQSILAKWEDDAEAEVKERRRLSAAGFITYNEAGTSGRAR